MKLEKEQIKTKEAKKRYDINQSKKSMTLKTRNQQRKTRKPKDEFFQNINNIDGPLVVHKFLTLKMKNKIDLMDIIGIIR